MTRNQDKREMGFGVFVLVVGFRRRFTKFVMYSALLYKKTFV